MWADEGYMELSNPQGETISAEIISVESEWVTLLMAMGSSQIRVEMSKFSEVSQKQLNEWAQQKSIMQGLEIGISSKTFESNDRDTVDTKREINKVGYSLRFTNSTRTNFEGLKIRYLMVVKRQPMAREKAKDYVIQVVRAKGDVPTIPANSTFKMDSEGVLLEEIGIKPGWRPPEGVQIEAKDELEGIILEVYQGDLLIHSIAKPKRLEKDYTINGPKAKAQ